SVVAASGIYSRGILDGSAYIDANRPTSGANTGNTFRLGALTIGDVPLTVLGGNGYGVEFAEDSQITGNATFHVTSASLTFGGALSQDAAGHSLTKTGASSLTFLGDASYSGATTIGGGALII